MRYVPPVPQSHTVTAKGRPYEALPALETSAAIEFEFEPCSKFENGFLLFYSSCTDKESHVLLEIIVHNPVVIDISTLSIPSAIHEAIPSVPSFCLEQRTHIRIFLIFPLSIYLKTRR